MALPFMEAFVQRVKTLLRNENGGGDVSAFRAKRLEKSRADGVETRRK